MSKLTARGTIVLVLVALGVLLVAPGMAQAHVKAKYRGDYKARLAALYSQGADWQQHWTTFRDTLAVWADQEQQLVNGTSSDPPDDPHGALLGLEQQCASFWNTYQPLPLIWKQQFDAPMSQYKARLKLYFSTVTEQRKFKKLCDKLQHGIGWDVIYTGHVKLVDAYFQLSQDPPGFDNYTELVNQGFAAYRDGSDEAHAAWQALRHML